MSFRAFISNPSRFSSWRRPSSNRCLERGIRLSPRKARVILHEGRARGRDISDPQRRFFGFVAGGCQKRRKKRNPSKWNRHVKAVSKKHPRLKGSSLFKKAKKSYGRKRRKNQVSSVARTARLLRLARAAAGKAKTLRFIRNPKKRKARKGKRMSKNSKWARCLRAVAKKTGKHGKALFRAASKKFKKCKRTRCGSKRRKHRKNPSRKRRAKAHRRRKHARRRKNAPRKGSRFVRRRRSRRPGRRIKGHRSHRGRRKFRVRAHRRKSFRPRKARAYVKSGRLGRRRRRNAGPIHFGLDAAMAPAPGTALVLVKRRKRKGKKVIGSYVTRSGKSRVAHKKCWPLSRKIKRRKKKACRKVALTPMANPRRRRRKHRRSRRNSPYLLLNPRRRKHRRRKAKRHGRRHRRNSPLAVVRNVGSGVAKDAMVLAKVAGKKVLALAVGAAVANKLPQLLPVIKKQNVGVKGVGLSALAGIGAGLAAWRWVSADSAVMVAAGALLFSAIKLIGVLQPGGAVQHTLGLSDFAPAFRLPRGLSDWPSIGATMPTNFFSEGAGAGPSPSGNIYDMASIYSDLAPAAAPAAKCGMSDMGDLVSMVGPSMSDQLEFLR